jgi:hypothetical protein
MSGYVKLVNVTAKHELMHAVVNDCMTRCAMKCVRVVIAHEHGVWSHVCRIHRCFRSCLLCSYIDYIERVLSVCLPPPPTWL